MNLIFQWMVTGLAALFASVLITACGAHSSNQSSENFTVYEDTPKMSLLDLGAPGNSLGDVYHFSAPLHSERGGPVTGEVIGSKTLVKVATDANPNLERRATLLFFTFADRKDQIIAFGVADYTPSAPEFDAGQPAVRAILGGTGKYMGVRGQVISTRNADGSYTQVFTLLK
ncbi:MAG: hypothetical protein ACJ8KF_08210 [Chthoniobacterales bacterium]